MRDEIKLESQINSQIDFLKVWEADSGYELWFKAVQSQGSSGQSCVVLDEWRVQKLRDYLNIWLESKK